MLLLLTLCALSAAAPLKVYYNQTSEQVEQLFIGNITKQATLSVVTFVGNSDAGYENTTLLSTILYEQLSNLQNTQVIINAGATGSGIGQVYKLAKKLNFTTTGIVSMRSVNASNPAATQWASGVDYVFCVDDASWGGYVGSPLNHQLSPTSNAMVKVTNVVVGIGGGKVAFAELSEAANEGIEVKFFAADQNHATAIAKAKKAGVPPPTNFEGAVGGLVMCDSPPHSIQDRCLTCGGSGSQSGECSAHFQRPKSLTDVAIRYAKPNIAANSTVKIAAFALEGVIIETEEDAHGDISKWHFKPNATEKLQALAADGYILMFFENNFHASETFANITTTTAAATTTVTTTTTLIDTTTGGSLTTAPQSTTNNDTPRPTPLATTPGYTTTGFAPYNTTESFCGKLPACPMGNCDAGNCVNGCCECPAGYAGCRCAMNPMTNETDACYEAHYVCGTNNHCYLDNNATTLATTTEATATASGTGCKGCPCKFGQCNNSLICLNNICTDAQTTNAPPPNTCPAGTDGCGCLGNPMTGLTCSTPGLACIQGICQSSTATTTGCTVGELGCSCAPNDVCLNGAVCTNTICTTPTTIGPMFTTAGTMARKRNVESHEGWVPLPDGQYNDTYINLLERKMDAISAKLNASFLYGGIALRDAANAGSYAYDLPEAGMFSLMQVMLKQGNDQPDFEFDLQNSFFVSSEGGRVNDTSCNGRLFAQDAGMMYMTPEQFFNNATAEPPADGACVKPTPPPATTNSPTIDTTDSPGNTTNHMGTNSDPGDGSLVYILAVCGAIVLLLCCVGGGYMFVQKRNAQKNRYTLLLADEDDLGP